MPPGALPIPPPQQPPDSASPREKWPWVILAFFMFAGALFVEMHLLGAGGGQPSVPSQGEAKVSSTTRQVESASSSTASSVAYGEFSNPQPVTIDGYTGSAEEPWITAEGLVEGQFLSRDGRHLYYHKVVPAPSGAGGILAIYVVSR